MQYMFSKLCIRQKVSRHRQSNLINSKVHMKYTNKRKEDYFRVEADPFCLPAMCLQLVKPDIFYALWWIFFLIFLLQNEQVFNYINGMKSKSNSCSFLSPPVFLFYFLIFCLFLFYFVCFVLTYYQSARINFCEFSGKGPPMPLKDYQNVQYGLETIRNHHRNPPSID